METATAQLATKGFFLQPAVFSATECEAMVRALGPVHGAGRRGLLDHTVVKAAARSESLATLIRPHLPHEPKAVRAIFFDKTPETNWLVAWHQDLTIAVRERHDLPGWGPWSVKNGIHHVQPPAGLLEEMVTVRIHLDDTDQSNGALMILPGSHRRGRLSGIEIRTLTSAAAPFTCEARAGDVLVMRPLLLHSSSRSKSASSRRVLHIEFAGLDLQAPLEWNDAA